MSESKFLKVAKKAALEAGKILSKYPRKNTKLAIKNEDNSDLVGNADVDIENLLLKFYLNWGQAGNCCIKWTNP